jgi:hypothetical protein
MQAGQSLLAVGINAARRIKRLQWFTPFKFSNVIFGLNYKSTIAG